MFWESNPVLRYLVHVTTDVDLRVVMLTPHSHTVSIRYDNPRQLIYQWGSNPSVSWNWWIDPNSSTYLVRKEFRHMNLLSRDYSLVWNKWENLWPFRYPAWFNHCAHPEDDTTYWQALFERAQERANRRIQKKSMKAARAQGWKKRDQMPGAWPV